LQEVRIRTSKMAGTAVFISGKDLKYALKVWGRAFVTKNGSTGKNHYCRRKAMQAA